MFSFMAALMKMALVKNIALGVSLAAPIGPVSIEVIKRGIRHGFRAAFIVCLGGAVGDTIYLVIAYFGLSSIINMPLVRCGILVFGAGVLFFLGIQSILDGWRRNYLEGAEDDAPIRHGLSAFMLGIFLAVANPMSVMWWVGIFGGMMSSAPEVNASLISNMTIIIGVLVWSLFLSSLLAFGKRFVNSMTFKIISVAAGSCLIYFGGSFLYQVVGVFLGL